ncbi:hypothetical protein BDM02DRAFT_3107457 [Thelephora ganbajun]|uniref:Uncharacterized protein n=1 Tax=Thelephora ganbajun TaxID=370292 RepID=A0ACB6ZVT2_THEGA|nr:hypothetical protein BDM02DRAFT_3107457 [Thelephora ganbajun]
MTNNTVTPTERLLQVAKTRPFAPAVRHGSSTWSYAALWARVRELAKLIERLDQSRGPVGLHMGWVSHGPILSHILLMSRCIASRSIMSLLLTPSGLLVALPSFSAPSGPRMS